MPERIEEVRFRFEAAPSARTTNKTAGLDSSFGPPLPRISRLMALAIQLQALWQQYPDLDASQAARHAHVCRTRITQILNLLWLAPDIQEHLLWLKPLTRGREVITEKSLRRLTSQYDWERQRERFTEMLARRSRLFHTAAGDDSNTSNVDVQISESTTKTKGSPTMTSNNRSIAMGGRHA